MHYERPTEGGHFIIPPERVTLVQKSFQEHPWFVRNAKLSATVLMLVIHAGFRERCLVLWGESSIDDRVPAEPGVHPFSARYEQLAETLEKISVKVPRVEAVSNEVLLPSFDRMPVPSSPLLGKEAQGKKAVDLRPWQVETLSLQAAAALEFLCLGTEKEMLEPGVMAGVDLAYWATAMRFAGSLVARQQFLPDLVREVRHVVTEKVRLGGISVVMGEDSARSTVDHHP